MSTENETAAVEKRYRTKLTAQGAAALAACILDGTKLDITHIAAGDGSGAYYEPQEEQDALVREVWRGRVLSCEKNPLHPNTLDIKGTIPSDASGFVVRELGVFDKDGTLIGVCNTPDMEKAARSSGAGGKLDLIMHLLVTDANAVRIFVKPSLDTISLEDALKLIDERLTNIEDMVRAKGGGELILPEALGVGPYVIEFTEEAADEYATKADLSKYATKESPVFTGGISLGRETDSELGYNSIAAGLACVSSGTRTQAFGSSTRSIGNSSFAEGFSTLSSGQASHAEGQNTVASGDHSHAEGFATEACGLASHAEGASTIARGYASHAEGNVTKANAEFSHAGGSWTVADAEAQTVIGVGNKSSVLSTDRFIIGKGSSKTPANCFRVTDTGTYASGNYNASGADYAELFEWDDGNPDAEDRVGLFVVLNGEKMRLAAPEDDDRDILGIVSGNPSVVGDVHDDQWQGMYLYDVYGRPIFENVNGELRQKRNPNYDASQKYIPRSKRPEWAAVGLLGKLVLIDDGTCEVNGWCAAGAGGIAVKSARRTRFRCMSRLDDTHIRVNIMIQ